MSTSEFKGEFGEQPMTESNEVSSPDPFKPLKVKVTLAMAQTAITTITDSMKEFLLDKNRSYGNSVFDPIHIFAKGSTAREQIMVRIDDKLNRIKFGSEFPGDDTIKDLAGYLLLYLCCDCLGL